MTFGTYILFELLNCLKQCFDFFFLKDILAIIINNYLLRSQRLNNNLQRGLGIWLSVSHCGQSRFYNVDWEERVNFCSLDFVDDILNNVDYFIKIKKYGYKTTT